MVESLPNIKYRVEHKRSGDDGWSIDSEESHLNGAMNTARMLNKGFSSGTCIHRVVDIDTGEMKYVRGWLDDDQQGESK